MVTLNVQKEAKRFGKVIEVGDIKCRKIVQGHYLSCC